MTKSTPSFQFYPADFLADGDLEVLDLDALGAFWRLVCFEWREVGLPNDQRKLRKLAGADAGEWPRIWEQIEHLFNERDGRLFQSGSDKKRKKQADFRAKKAAAGRASGKARREQAVNRSGTPREQKSNTRPTRTPTNANPSSSSSFSSSSSRKAENRAREARRPTEPPEEQLRTWLGAHAGVLDDFAAMGQAAGVNHGPVWEAGLWGLYRPPGHGGEQDEGGTAVRDFGGEPVEDWPGILARALTEAGAKGQKFSPKFVGGCVRQVVRSREAERKRSKSVPYLTADQEDQEEANRRAVARSSSGPTQIQDVGTLIAKAEAETKAINDEAEARAEWFAALPEAARARIAAVAKSRAEQDLPESMKECGVPEGMLGVFLSREIQDAWNRQQEGAT